MNTVSGHVSNASKPATISANSAMLWPPDINSLRTSVMEPSAESMTASVAVSGSRKSRAVCASPTVQPTVCANAAAAMNDDTNMTFSTLRVARASRRAAASTGSVHVIPVDVSA